MQVTVMIVSRSSLSNPAGARPSRPGGIDALRLKETHRNRGTDGRAGKKEKERHGKKRRTDSQEGKEGTEGHREPTLNHQAI